MSNLTEKNTPKRSPLARVPRTPSINQENPLDVESTLARYAFSSTKKLRDDSIEIKKKVQKPSKEKIQDDDFELARYLRGNLSQAMTENDSVRLKANERY